MAASGAEMNNSGLSNLGNWTLAQLRELAKRPGLGGYSRMTKSGLLNAVQQALPTTSPTVALKPEQAPESEQSVVVPAPAAPQPPRSGSRG